MKKILRTATSMLAFILCACMMLTCVGLAYSVDVEIPVSVFEIPVEVDTSGDVPDPAETYRIHLKAVEAEAAMPEGSVDGEYVMEVVGECETAFPKINYESVGVWHYLVWQEPGGNPKCPYDSTVYEVTVYVVYTEDHEDLEASMVANKQGSTDKCDIVFKNHYYPPVDLTVKKVWKADEGLNLRPDSIVVQLMEDGVVVEEVTLDDDNDWTYTWEELFGGSKWTVCEIVPKGYINSIKYKGDTATITNTAALIQTGQLNWPVPVMAVLGVVLVLFGMKLYKKENAHE